MKTYISIVLLVLFFSSVAYSQTDTTHRARRADSVMTFFVSSEGPFDDWPLSDTNKERFGDMSMPKGEFRYYNIEDSLGLNAENRGFWDLPTQHPAPKDTVLGG